MTARPLIVRFGVLLCAVCCARESPSAPPQWEPYRDVQAAQSAAPATPPALPSNLADSIRTAQLPLGESVLFPQPVFAAPPCAAECYGAAPGYMIPPGTSYFDPTLAAPPNDPQFWQWRVLPDGVIWQSYWAGAREPRISGVVYHDENSSVDLLDVTLGGRASLLRYGTAGPGRPEGFEVQVEGAGFPRLNLNENWDLDAADFRFGVPLVYGRDRWQAKFSYYHLSSHMGDELAIREGVLGERINYSRDALVLGLSYFPLPAWRWYAEAEWAFHYDESEPWAFQFGVDVAQPGPTGPTGTPFVAINGHIREEVDYGGNVVVQAGWLWRGYTTHVLRVGFHYFNGKSNQFEFFNNFEQQIGGGLWYDF